MEQKRLARPGPLNGYLVGNFIAMPLVFLYGAWALGTNPTAIGAALIVIGAVGIALTLACMRQYGGVRACLRAMMSRHSEE